MSFTGLLGHRVTVRRKLEGNDRFGQPIQEWNEENELSGISCRLRAATGREMTNFAARDNLEVTHMLYVDPDVSITEADQVAEVLDAGGIQLLKEADVVLVRKVSGMEGAGHHLEVALRALRIDDNA